MKDAIKNQPCLLLACFAFGLSTFSHLCFFIARAIYTVDDHDQWIWIAQTTFADPFGDIGGPMDIGDGYRWNVPVVTYGFDQSFLDYFGTNGVAAVEGAIQILNDLPPASSIVPD